MKKINLISLFAFLCFVCFFMPSVLEAQISSIERDALIALYNSTDGANWANNTNWLGAPGTEGTWYGVTLDAGGNYVVWLDLRNNQLNGRH